MDREIAPEVRTRRITRRVVTTLVAIAAIAFTFAATVQWLRPSVERRSLRTAQVTRGSVEATLEATGTVVPLSEQLVSSPVEARVLRIGRRAGERVRAGDELLELDTAAARLEAERLGNRLSQAESAETESTIRLDESVATLRAQIEQKKLDAEIDQYTAEQKRRLRAEGLIAEQDALGAQAAARKSAIEIRQLEDALARTLRSREAQMASARAATATARREREEARRQLELAMLRADRDGVLTSIVSETGATVRRGDVLARIADLSAYRVEATISDVHASRLAPGLRVRVKLDDQILGGAIDAVDPRIVNGVVRFFVTLDEPGHRLLRNNLRVDVAVVTGSRSGVLRVERGALGRSDDTRAFVIRGDEAVRTPVRFGLASSDVIEIVEGLGEGETVVISDMTDHADVAAVRLK